MTFKNKKIYYFDVISSKKHFKKQSLPHSQTPKNESQMLFCSKY
jgi:hypothetical protein